MLYCANLAEACPGIGTPMDVAEKYQLFHPDFFKEMTGPERFIYDILTLSEHKRHQKEESARAEETKKMPGVSRFVSSQERSKQLAMMRKREGVSDS